MQKKIGKETEMDRKKLVGDTNVVSRHIIKFIKSQDKYKALVSNAKDKEHTAQPNTRSGAAFGRRRRTQ